MTPAALREQPIHAWYFAAIHDGVPVIASHGRTNDADALTVEAGYVYTTDEPRITCCPSHPDEGGLHWSRSVRDALRYAPQSERLAVCRVRAWGEVDEQSDKGASRHREVLWVADATVALRWWALECALRVEKRAKDPRVAACNQATEDYLRGRITRDELLRARAAAYAAADAADAAADAADAAAAAAAAAARQWQSDELERRMRALLPKGVK